MFLSNKINVREVRFNRNIMGCKERIIERLFDDSGDLIGT